MSEINEKKIILSQEKFDEYKKQYDHLINIERPAVQEALKEARAQGDLSENAEYDAAREKQGIVEGRIKELEAILDNAAILDSSIHKTDETIGINTRVEFLIQENNKIEVVQITGSHDADPFEGKISMRSPLAIAMMGKVEGDEVEVEAQKKFMIKILKVEHL
ncbi:transcription elongation factor GreA [Mycoplasmopsis cynos]|uniref:transcription elongation factor GreA n=1 Tax=Mycoplasmopsis cynos TaxID=171284 RepID=UPI002AFFAE92|nr:transcription elongation factor GreA [Mycoplasmopsis cynos]WQQ16308.1 transcription elongation factor GreA [Mycoplasmopsis cynos]WQQ16730.1 transcription elongation factor GreA [Mycoplasmopsis cynos]WQQ17797.1 transcription elongation factor GreA [Mycoplasmopsis cynos]WQQ18738.1 transcription elongation factor GreA [Mycoplasmopsis cynos]